MEDVLAAFGSSGGDEASLAVLGNPMQQRRRI